MIALAELGELRLGDEMLVDLAERDSRIVVTFDLDIPRILALRHAAFPSAVVLRVSQQTPRFVIPRLLAAVDQHLESLALGSILVVTDADSRLRRLPIGY